ncbi:MAG TPA: Uma2 family endonuclease [Gemmataceae bacterium]|jgi:Uma2 family endonuclease|nr:Uma2 family endonuclease [Gemmataceae bacterium]
MSVVFTEVGEIEIPARVIDLDTFRRWVHSLDVPEDAKVYWIGGEVWVDMSNEQIFTHVDVKTEFVRVLANLAIKKNLGRVRADGALYSNEEADISVNPDAIFILHASREEGRVKFIEGRKGGYVEIQGTLDMVLEVVSRRSVTKDTELLLHAYWKAGIPEYWLVDARKSPARFDIFRHTREGYVATRRRDGWLKSLVFGKQFQFVESKDRFGTPEYRLEVK